jgi:hypothetical protein
MVALGVLIVVTGVALAAAIGVTAAGLTFALHRVVGG